MKEMKPQYVYKATVTKVVDGDTVDLLVDCGFNIIRKERIRFYGVDAWETRGEERERGLQAKRFVQDLFLLGLRLLSGQARSKGSSVDILERSSWMARV